jgi:hypothetical protein
MSTVATPQSRTNADAIFDNMGDELKASFTKFGSILNDVFNDVTDCKVITQDTSNPANILYQTVIKIDGGAINTFQATKPDANDEYWQRHNALVDQAFQTRTQIMLKMVEAVGGILKVVPV